jgi:hypothetical protein
MREKRPQSCLIPAIMEDLHHHEQADSIAFMPETLPKGLYSMHCSLLNCPKSSRKDIQFVEEIP